jgi:Heat shock transcription factor
MNNEEFLHKLIKSSACTQIEEEKQIEGNSTKDIARSSSSSKEERVIAEQEFLVPQQQISKKKRARDEDCISDNVENGDGKKRADDRKQTNTNGNEAVVDDKKKEAEYRSGADGPKECSRGGENKDSRVIVDRLHREMTAPPRVDDEDTPLPMGLGKAIVEKVRREGEVNKHEQQHRGEIAIMDNNMIERIVSDRREGLSYLTRLESTKTESYCLQNGEEDKKCQEVHTTKTPKENTSTVCHQTDTRKVLQNDFFPKEHVISGSGRSEPFTQGLDGSILMSYGDFSRVKNDGIHATSTDPSGKEPPFPVKLHRILSNPDFTDIICWLPHGRSWRVLKPKAFEERIIPMYFRHAKYASFMRQVR